MRMFDKRMMMSVAANVRIHEAKSVDYSGEEYRACGFFDRNVWCRTVVDFIKTTPKTAFVVDWKTGKRKTDDDQLSLMAGVVFAQLPEIEKVVSLFLWIQDGDHDKQQYSRSDIPDIWKRFIVRADNLNQAFIDGDFPPRPSGICRKYCPVNACPHHGT